MDWSKNFRGDVFDRALIWNRAHLRQALREYERHYNEHRTTDCSLPQHPCVPGTSPLDLTGSNASRYFDGTVSVESVTSNRHAA
ncbi:hypothetical protein SAMN04488564_11717 [Lentzea waywayandensis]|uniref:Integrase core domain-containing protein n=1 Tax=Lentzea waywayandensis TaxID=84724 RepID=A0A1I6FGM4_9PSEU|nr:hypothetical protein [Lentzea waywayandensis]SFR29093.1 hypothetical protein SAMN04488564_11717 [Lentzea waywayandensis]